METLIGLVILGIIYFIPTIVASSRKHKSAGGIFITNIVFGWTLIGWIISLIWASSNTGQNQTIIIQQTK